ncbi:MAG: amino acid dehydrogenase [Bacteroidetes bacterium]|nr:MAG: amino acid dehydrogenase [Bacteroidota bacterium]
MYHNANFEDLLKKYEHKAPEIVFEWHDSETEAVGWVVINSLRGGAAGGGTRMRKGLDKHEVESLAKTMEIKFTICGPAIGGAKSGINFDPNDPRKAGVLKRWYKAVYPLLKNYYGTGGDLNVDEIHEVIPITESYGLLHPQEGVVNGHMNLEPAETAQRIKQLQDGVLWKLTDARYTPKTDGTYTVADMITGWGVSEAIRHYYDIYGGQIAGKRAIVQGWGNVAAAAAYYQAQLGVKVVGIIDREGGLIKEEGFTFEEITELFVNKDGNKLRANNVLSFEEVNSRIWDIGAEIMIPAAASRLLTQDQIARMAKADLEVISCGANVPFADQEIFFGPIANFSDQLVSIIPDFIANCGMARVFAYLMGENAVISDEAIFNDASAVIRKAMMRLHQFNPKPTGLAKKGLELSLTTIMS